MASIGGVSCTYIRLRGYLDPQQRIVQYQEEGINGVGFEDLAQGAGFFSFQCELVGTNAEVNTWRGNIAALKAAGIISCTDDWEDEYTNLQVEEITPMIKHPRIQDGEVKVKGLMTVSGSVTE